MPRIPINKYPNQAGYTVLNTDTNQLEVFSDGTYKPVGPEPELLQGGDYELLLDPNPITITVGPGKDFEYLDEAVWNVYKQNIWDSPYISTANRSFYGKKLFKIIIASDFVFDKDYRFYNMFLPNLEITQEDYTIPLMVRVPLALTLGYGTVFRRIQLNLEGDPAYSVPVVGIYFDYFSTAKEVQISAKRFESAISLRYGSKVFSLIIDNATQLKLRALLLMFNCYAHVTVAHISDVGRTLPDSNGAAFLVNQSDLRIYYGQNTIIDNVVTAFRIQEQGRIVISEGNLTISNATNGIHFPFNGGSLIAKPATITYTNVTNKIKPTTIIPNEWSPDGIVIV